MSANESRPVACGTARRAGDSTSSLRPDSDILAGPDLDALRVLAAAGIPLFESTPDRHYLAKLKFAKPGQTVPEFKFPTAWERTPADPSFPDRVAGTPQPRGLHMLCTAGVIALDIDTEAGHVNHVKGHPDAVVADILRAGVEPVALVTTPSGGRHVYCAAPFVQTNHGGIDRPRNVFLPGTTRPKYPGRGYSWLKPPDLSRLGDPDWCAGQAAAVARFWDHWTGASRAPAPQVVPDHDGAPLERAVPPWLAAKLADLDAAPVGRRSQRFHALVGACRREGFTPAQTAALLDPWCHATGKFVGRVGAEVARCWPKVEPGPTVSPATVGDPAELEPERPSGGRDGRAPGMATRLVQLALDGHTLGWAADGSGPFAVAHGTHLALPLRGGRNSLRAVLARAAHRDFGVTPSAAALADALVTLEGYAADSPPTAVHLRAAVAEGVVWLDLGDESGRAVRIAPAGWAVVDRAPVVFRRSELTGPLPTPERGGDIASLWRFANVRADLRPLVLAWLLAVLLSDRPCPVCALIGEQGTGKSTATRLLGGLLDPSPAATRKPPRDIEGWVVAAAGSRVVAVDNLSGIAEWFSDSLCRAVTGDADVRRTLYTDGGLTVFAFRRAVLLNGIDFGAVRPDLADRLLPITLERIPESSRVGEQDLPRLWAAEWPRILGAVLDLAVRVLADMASATAAPESLPRMADFGRVLHSLDRVLGTRAADTYGQLADDLAGDSVALDPVLAALVAEVTAPFAGTASELLARLDRDRQGSAPREWPRTPRGLVSHLVRHAPALRRLGWTLERGRDPRGKSTVWALEPPSKSAGVVPGLPGLTSAEPRQPRQIPVGIVADQATNGGNGADVAGVADVETPPTLLTPKWEKGRPRETVTRPAHDMRCGETTPATSATPAAEKSPTAGPVRSITPALACAACGLPMASDFYGDQMHPTCSGVPS